MENKNNLGKGILAGSAVVAMVATIAGAYFLYGSKNATKNRKQVKAWMLKAKGEILEKIENISEISEPMYHKIVQEVADKYQAVKNIDKKDIEAFVKELQSHWKGIEKEIKSFGKKKKKS
jgi:uncharacterized membrane protein YfbV (UPF0208 family)